MKKVSQPETILRAFTVKPTIDEETLKERRKICAGCPFNSDNAEDKDLTFAQKTRKRLVKKPFCTACGCQIYEKTSQETEECGLARIGKKPKWNRVKVQTKGDMDLNIISESPSTINVDLSKDGSEFIIDFSEVEPQEPVEFSFLIQTKSDEIPLELSFATPSCSSCTELVCKRVNSNTYRFKVKLKVNLLSGEVLKSILLGYVVDGDYKKGSINIKGTIK